MNDYNRNSFYTVKDEVTGKRKYYIKVGTKKVEVSSEVYNVCYNSYKKQFRDNYKDQEFGLLSYDRELDDGITLLDKIRVDKEPSNDVELIIDIINTLDDKDKKLITELLVEEKKEKEVAELYHLTQQGINKRKKRIIKEIRNKLNKKQS